MLRNLVTDVSPLTAAPRGAYWGANQGAHPGALQGAYQGAYWGAVDLPSTAGIGAISTDSSLLHADIPIAAFSRRVELEHDSLGCLARVFRDSVST